MPRNPGTMNTEIGKGGLLFVRRELIGHQLTVRRKDVQKTCHPMEKATCVSVEECLGD